MCWISNLIFRQLHMSSLKIAIMVRFFVFDWTLCTSQFFFSTHFGNVACCGKLNFDEVLLADPDQSWPLGRSHFPSHCSQKINKSSEFSDPPCPMHIALNRVIVLVVWGAFGTDVWVDVQTQYVKIMTTYSTGAWWVNKKRWADQKMIASRRNAIKSYCKQKSITFSVIFY